jgi:hypothetical protein
MQSNLDDIAEGFQFFLDFDIKKYAEENNDMPPISVLNKQLRNKNLQFKDEEGKRIQTNQFFALIKELFYELNDNQNVDDPREFSKIAKLGRKNFIRFLRGDRSFSELFPTAVSFGLFLAWILEKN